MLSPFTYNVVMLAMQQGFLSFQEESLPSQSSCPTSIDPTDRQCPVCAISHSIQEHCGNSIDIFNSLATVSSESEKGLDWSFKELHISTLGSKTHYNRDDVLVNKTLIRTGY